MNETTSGLDTAPVPTGTVSAAATEDGRVVLAIVHGDTPTAVVLSWMDAMRVGRAVTTAGYRAALTIGVSPKVLVDNLIGIAR